MTTRCRVTLLVACTLLPGTAAALTYKCVVNGRTTYQQQPCAVAADAPAAPAARTGRAADASPDADRMVPLAREAFDDLLGGRVDGYVARLCTPQRREWSRPAMRRSLAGTAAGYARRKVELGQVLERDPRQVTFAAAEGDPGTGLHAQRLRINAGFDWEAGQPCLTGLEAVRSPG